MPTAPRLLLVEDDRELSVLLDRVLGQEGYQVETAPDGQRGLHLALTRQFDVAVVDRGLPAIDGVDLIARLRRSGAHLPILVLSARGTAQDRVAGLDAGAEDYLVKPFDLDELLARLRALLRRHGDAAQELAVPGGRFLPELRMVELDAGATAQLSAREAELLRLLAVRPGQVFSRSDLLARVFADAESEAVVDTYVHYLRRKLGRDVVRTVRGLGYRLGPR